MSGTEVSDDEVIYDPATGMPDLAASLGPGYTGYPDLYWRVGWYNAYHNNHPDRPSGDSFSNASNYITVCVIRDEEKRFLWRRYTRQVCKGHMYVLAEPKSEYPAAYYLRDDRDTRYLRRDHPLAQSTADLSEAGIRSAAHTLVKWWLRLDKRDAVKNRQKKLLGYYPPKKLETPVP